MKRQEILLNLTLVTVIGALGYSIYDAHQKGSELAGIVSRAHDEESDEEESPATETIYNRAEANKRFPNVGNTDLFKSLIPPTPSPTPVPPKPTETPNINMALNAWQVLSVDAGVVTVEDVIKSRQGADDAVFEMKKGDTRPIDIGGNQTRLVKLEATAEDSNTMEYSATFSMQDTNATRTLKMGEPAGANTNVKEPTPAAPQG